MEVYYSEKQLMEKFDCSRSTIRAWFERGLVKTKIGKLARVKESDLKSFLDKEEKVD